MYASCRHWASEMHPYFFSSLHSPCHALKPLLDPKMSASHPLPAAHTFSFNELYDSGVAPSLGNLSLSSGNPVSGPSTPVEGSLLSPAHIYHLANNNASTYTDKRIHENSAYIQELLNRCRRLEEDLSKEKQEHNLLKYVRVFLDYSMI